MPADRLSRRPIRGFTLLELAVVLAIIGVVTALTLPRLRQVSQDNAAAREASDFAEMVREASALARSTRTIICVEGRLLAPGAEFRFTTPSSPAAGCQPAGTPNVALGITHQFPNLIDASLTVQHLRPGPAVAITPSGAWTVFWAETDAGEPGGDLGVPSDNGLWGLGIGGFNGFPRSPVEVHAAFGTGTVARTVTHYVSGTVHEVAQ